MAFLSSLFWISDKTEKDRRGKESTKLKSHWSPSSVIRAARRNDQPIWRRMEEVSSLRRRLISPARGPLFNITHLGRWIQQHMLIRLENEEQRRPLSPDLFDTGVWRGKTHTQTLESSFFYPISMRGYISRGASSCSSRQESGARELF